MKQILTSKHVERLARDASEALPTCFDNHFRTLADSHEALRIVTVNALEAAYEHFFIRDSEEMGPEEYRELEALVRSAITAARKEHDDK